MLKKTTRIALLGSATAFVVGTAYAQDTEQAQGNLDPEACATLAERLANDTEIDAEIRSEIETVISEGDVERCGVIFTTWEEEGAITQETLELVATETVTERMIVQQEIEVDADAAVYQPPAEISVDAGAPEIVWTLPRQTVTVEEQAPEVVVRQGRPTVNVEVPQPRVSVMIPEPEVIVTWPDSTAALGELEPDIEVRMPEPTVSVNMPDPIVELTIGGEEPRDLVELEDGRFAPQGATEEDLEPRIDIAGQEPVISRAETAEEPEIVFNRGEPEVTIEREEAEVFIDVLGEPEVNVTMGAATGDGEAPAEDTEQTGAPAAE